ncbi:MULTISPECIES: 1,2-phenylacetyl-CoA epoxidase subunit PaaC [unclassified Streptomyces]|uniref:1,2-phenylacetyl-CoA epoxidase subunit PaaC n=1 Tax=unclassified Streptomyces TaxID=2593676 RepID=UPI0022B5F3BB|nr:MULTISPECIES: 1,2-phenylacetyl-CoA epoxidase subunit PaaC [unclassified Streptomyces]MCZ7417817.1 phenylacetate-CoA oxygenase subunit PaaC [Streptomyces sp. WMMC897]MCZ7432378.1 phenylacetate-CoA oxygenase subunit PaaC [Streptomyces sp. WMMC1477]
MTTATEITAAGPAVGSPESDTARYALALGDDALILCQRLSAWVTRAPSIEEDLALSNIALDLLGHARTLLSYCAELTGRGDEDTLAFTRTDRQFRNVLLAEIPNGDFAVTIARQLCLAHHARLLYTALSASRDPVLAGFAGKAVQESAYHCTHAGQWTVRLGTGTEESRRRMRAGLEQVWPYTAELFETDEATARLAASGVAVDPAGLREEWDTAVGDVLTRAGLPRPEPSWHARGGRDGLHTEAFGPLLAELQAVHRQYPGGNW